MWNVANVFIVFEVFLSQMTNPTAAIGAAASRSARSQTVYLPGVNGLRVIAALAVLVFYLYTLLGKFRQDTTINYIVVFELVIGATIFIAWLSYTFYEKKFLKLKAKYSTVKSSSSLSEQPH